MCSSNRSGRPLTASTATLRGLVLHPVMEGRELVFTAIDFLCPLDAVYEDVELG